MEIFIKAGNASNPVMFAMFPNMGISMHPVCLLIKAKRLFLYVLLGEKVALKLIPTHLHYISQKGFGGRLIKTQYSHIWTPWLPSKSSLEAGIDRTTVFRFKAVGSFSMSIWVNVYFSTKLIYRLFFFLLKPRGSG